LPMMLNKGELKKMKKHIGKFDRLRKIRNDIVHKNLKEEFINKKAVSDGINAGIKIIEFLKDKKV